MRYTGRDWVKYPFGYFTQTPAGRELTRKSICFIIPRSLPGRFVEKYQLSSLLCITLETSLPLAFERCSQRACHEISMM